MCENAKFYTSAVYEKGIQECGCIRLVTAMTMMMMPLMMINVKNCGDSNLNGL